MIKEIAEGWYNEIRNQFGKLPPHLKDMADKRLKVCSTCPQRKENKCGLCGCFLTAKTKSADSKCPIDIWPKK